MRVSVGQLGSSAQHTEEPLVLTRPPQWVLARDGWAVGGPVALWAARGFRLRGFRIHPPPPPHRAHPPRGGGASYSHFPVRLCSQTKPAKPAKPVKPVKPFFKSIAYKRVPINRGRSTLLIQMEDANPTKRRPSKVRSRSRSPSPSRGRIKKKSKRQVPNMTRSMSRRHNSRKD